MNLIPIKKSKIKKDGQEIEVFIVPAMNITQSNAKEKKVPHPDGTTSIIFPTLEKAIEAINFSGFSYSLYKEMMANTATYNSHSDLSNIINPIMGLLKDKNSDVVASAAFALGEMTCKEAVSPLIEILGLDDFSIRKNAIEALAKIGEPALKQLIKSLDDPNWVARNSAAITLGEMADCNSADLTSAIGPLLNKFNDNQSIVRSSSVIALGKIYKQVKKQEKDNYR